MKGQSVSKPEIFVPYQAGLQYRYNIKFVESVEDEKPSAWEYEYVNVASKDRSILIDAVITAKHSYSAQIGKAAKLDSDESKIEYIAFVASVKAMVDESLASETFSPDGSANYGVINLPTTE